MARLLNALISFLIIALVVYFLIVRPMNMLVARVTPGAEEAELAVFPEWLGSLSLEANRCPNCTTWLRGPNVAVS